MLRMRSRSHVFGFVASLLLFPSALSRGAESAGNSVENSVVKIFATVRYPDYFRPWAKLAPMEVTGSGVVVRGRRILSNAHVVLYASQVQIQANQAGDKLNAAVEFVAPDIDLAILKLEDESFFDRHPPLPHADALPDVRDSVMVYGYPEGGSSLSVTKGIVSRIEYVPSMFRAGNLLIQIDAAINSGNSGGPAVAGDKLIGLASARLDGADNIGYIIPTEEIELFLKDTEDGRYDGKLGMYDELQTLENPALRAFLKLPASVEGIVVHKPNTAIPNNPLKEWDVITKIGDTPIDNQGEVRFSPKLRVRFPYLIQRIAKDGKVPLTIFREGREMQVQMPLSTKRPMVIPSLEDRYPSYFVYGPLVFSEASNEFVSSFRRSDFGYVGPMLALGGSPLYRRIGDAPAYEDEALLIVSSPLFPHRLSTGYSNPVGQTVKSLNGKPIRNLKHLVETLRDCKDEFIAVEFDIRGFATFVFKHAEMLSATEDILSDNGIRSQGSPDTMAIWNAKQAM